MNGPLNTMNKTWTVAFLIGTVVLATGRGQAQPQAQSGRVGTAATPASQAQLDTNNQEDEKDFDWAIRPPELTPLEPITD
jgi:hypothetical protein